MTVRAAWWLRATTAQARGDTAFRGSRRAWLARHRRKWQRRRREALMRPKCRAGMAGGALGHRAHIAEAVEWSCYIPGVGRNLAMRWRGIGRGRQRFRQAEVAHAMYRASMVIGLLGHRAHAAELQAIGRSTSRAAGEAIGQRPSGCTWQRAASRKCRARAAPMHGKRDIRPSDAGSGATKAGST